TFTTVAERFKTPPLVAELRDFDCLYDNKNALALTSLVIAAAYRTALNLQGRSKFTIMARVLSASDDQIEVMTMSYCLLRQFDDNLLHY
ncbi:hypothetical protein L9F63_014997, partial [Diploptera punctata]